MPPPRQLREERCAAAAPQNCDSSAAPGVRRDQHAQDDLASIPHVSHSLVFTDSRSCSCVCVCVRARALTCMYIHGHVWRAQDSQTHFFTGTITHTRAGTHRPHAQARIRLRTWTHARVHLDTRARTLGHTRAYMWTRARVHLATRARTLGLSSLFGACDGGPSDLESPFMIVTYQDDDKDRKHHRHHRLTNRADMPWAHTRRRAAIPCTCWGTAESYTALESTYGKLHIALDHA